MTMKANQNQSQPTATGDLVSVIICTHNPRDDYFSRCLEGMKEQQLPCNQWELLIVDNMSSDPLQGRLDLEWHGQARIISEKKLGLTPARLRGIREARGELLVFVDDDNVLFPDFLIEAQRVYREMSHLGSWSGQCHPSFEETPPEWTRRYWGNLAIREFDGDYWSNMPRLPDTMPCGAGLCVRREVAQHYVSLHDNGKRGVQFDRCGDSLMSGGDNDLAACSVSLGLGVGIFSKLELLHIISGSRLEGNYLARLTEGICFSSTLLDHAWGLAVVSRSRGRKLLDFLRRLRLSAPERAIQVAAVHGHDKAVASIQKNNED